MTAHLFGNRKKGTGAIRKDRSAPGWDVYTPKRNGQKPTKIAHVDFYHQGVRILEVWLRENPAEAENDNEQQKAG